MDQIVVYPFPEDLEMAIKVLQAEGWITSVYSDVPDAVIYNPSNYLFNNEFHGIRYQMVIDRNILSFAVNACNKKNIGPKHRAALSLITFCGFANIQFNPTVAVYERANHNVEFVEQALEEMRTFFRIDDSPDLGSLLDFSIGKRDDFILKVDPVADGTVASMSQWFQKYTRLKEWDPLYLFVLKLTHLTLGKMTDKEKFREFIIWCHTEFRYSMVATFYAVILFSRNRLSKMIKYKLDQTREQRIGALQNMTWDLFTMNYFIRELQNKEKNVEVFFASDDKVVRSLIKSVLWTSDDPTMEKLRGILHENDKDLVDIYQTINTSSLERQFQGKYFKDPDQRTKLIKEYEALLL